MKSRVLNAIRLDYLSFFIEWNTSSSWSIPIRGTGDIPKNPDWNARMMTRCSYLDAYNGILFQCPARYLAGIWILYEGSIWTISLQGVKYQNGISMPLYSWYLDTYCFLPVTLEACPPTSPPSGHHCKVQASCRKGWDQVAMAFIRHIWQERDAWIFSSASSILN